MTGGVYSFDGFTLDLAERQLRRDGAVVELSARYFDALVLMVGEAGSLVTKDRFMDEVWRGIPVTDEALTQCVRSLRKALEDNAGRPRFIETVPKYGYRFVAVVEQPISPSLPREGLGWVSEVSSEPSARTHPPAPPLEGRGDMQLTRSVTGALIAGAGAIGGGFAGMIGGAIYAFAGVTQPLAPGMGSISVLLVLMSLCILVGFAGGFGVGAGIAAALLRGGSGWQLVLFSGLGGWMVGAVAKLLGVDAFNLLLGSAPRGITGAGEGVLLGLAIGAGLWWGGWDRLRRSASLTALTTGTAAVAISLLGGRLMAGSLHQLAKMFPQSRLQLDQMGALFGEATFGPIARTVTAACEGALFGGCVAAAMILAHRQMFGRSLPAA